MKKISWGIIGLGNIANKFADAFSIVDNANLKGIASLNNNKLIDFKKKFKINNEFCFNKYEDLISSSSVDIIYIALPNSLHAKYIQYSINKKKNILVEKPAFTNTKEFTITKDLLAKKKFFLVKLLCIDICLIFKAVKKSFKIIF